MIDSLAETRAAERDARRLKRKNRERTAGSMKKKNMDGKKTVCLLCALLFLFFGMSLRKGALAAAAGDRAAETEALLAEILAWNLKKSGADSLQAWVDGTLAESADGSGGWYLTALKQGGTAIDDARCRERLEKAAGEESRSITKRLRVALFRTALGMETAFAEEALDALAEERTLMPLVFGLHLANNGIVSAAISREEIMDRLLALQLADGGWAVIGDACDVDCTAMTLQALAPMTQDEAVQAAAERGLAALSVAQQGNGGFLGMGQESAESCAQVLLALSCLGLDPEQDARFVKNGFSVMDALLRFRLEDGSFCHALGQDANETATVQTFYAMTGYLRMLRGEREYYLFDTEGAPAPEGGAGMNAAEAAGGPEGGGAISQGLMAGIAALAGLLCCLISWLRGRRNARTYAFIALVTLGGILCAFSIRIQTPEGYYAGKPAEADGPMIRTAISIRCDPVAGRSQYAPADGTILTETEIRIPEGSTAFDQLAEATRSARIQMEYDGTTAGAYVRGIAYLYEYDFGNLSGWMFRVNGHFADVGASMYPLQEGDRVEWIYSANIGKDVEP